MSNHEILGIPLNANAEEAKRAYRRLAMQHHPDRGGNEETFKRIQVAFDTLEATGFRPGTVRPATGASGTSGGHSRPSPRPKPESNWAPPEFPGDSFHRREYKPQTQAEKIKLKTSGNVTRPTAYEAMEGFNAVLEVHRGHTVMVYVPPGMPCGVGHRLTGSDGSKHLITIKFPEAYTVRGLHPTGELALDMLEVGDVMVTTDVQQRLVDEGGWIKLPDLFGDEVTIRVPQGANTNQMLRVAGRGYMGWDFTYNVPILERQNMYVKLRVRRD